MKTIYNLIHIYLSPWYRKTTKNNSFSQKYFQPFLNAIEWVVSNFAYTFLYRTSIISDKNISSKVWLLVSSVNNKESLKFIKEDLDDAVFVSTGTYGAKNPIKDVARLSFHSGLIYLFRLPWYLLKHLFRHGFSGLRIIDKVVEANGMLEACKRILKKGEPRCLIFTNDHNIKMRGLLLAAKELRIPTVYLQHASVSESFPPLEFDLAILEGKDAEAKYRQVGSTDTKIVLGGMPKFDNYISAIKSKRKLQAIGICTNLLTDMTKLNSCIQFIQEKFPELKIHYRSHPRERRTLVTNKDIHISNSKEEGIFDFLQKIDAMIAGETSTHLEAALLNIPSLRYSDLTSNEFKDYYGYIETNLISEASSESELFSWIDKQKKDLDQPRVKTQYFNATVGTEWDGKSRQLALNHIKTLLKKESPLSA